MARACLQLTTVKQEDYLRYYLTMGMSNDVYIMPRYWVYRTPPEQKGLIRRITRPLPCIREGVPAYEVVASNLDDAIATVNYLATVTEKDAKRVYIRVLVPETEAKMSFAEGVTV
jgi:hypothetical protein